MTLQEVQPTPPLPISCSFDLQVKYKDGLQQKVQSSLYHQLPETSETQLAKQLTELQSQVTFIIIFITLRWSSIVSEWTRHASDLQRLL